MKTLALCCSTGVGDLEVDQVLVSLAADAEPKRALYAFSR